MIVSTLNDIGNLIIENEISRDNEMRMESIKNNVLTHFTSANNSNARLLIENATESGKIDSPNIDAKEINERCLKYIKNDNNGMRGKCILYYYSPEVNDSSSDEINQYQKELKSVIMKCRNTLSKAFIAAEFYVELKELNDKTLENFKNDIDASKCKTYIF